MTVHDELATLRTWADDIPGLGQKRFREALSRVEAEIARLEQRVTQVGDLVGFRDAWKQRAEAAEAEIARLERERDGYKRDFLAASERCERLERDRP